jgi:hypothetical protein
LKAFKKTIIIIFCKNNNKNYLNLILYRFIALLNIFKKILKAVISNCIYFLIETHTLLPDTQMGAQRMRFTDIALQFITKKIHAI